MKSFLPFIFVFSLTACGQTNGTKSKLSNQKITATKMQEGKDYAILKRFRLTDNKGFNQPVEALSFLLPASWQITSGIRWNVYNKCMAEMVQASLTAKSPDGEYELMMFPVTQFDFSDDPIQLDAMQRGFYGYFCHIAKPLDAAGYIRNVLAPMVKAQVTSSKIINDMQQQMDKGAQEMTMQARQAGNYAYNHRGNAAEGLLHFSDGKEGMAFCTLMQTIVSVPGSQGGMANNIQCYVSMRIVLKYPAGNNTMARKIMSTFFGGLRINPTWGNALQNFFAAVTKNAQDQNWKRIQISQQAQAEMGNNIIRNWEAKNKSTQSSGAATNGTEGFSQYLRGVESWKDNDGNTIELNSGYSSAWSRGDGSYFLSNNTSLDPNVAFGDTQSWSRMKQ